MIAIPNMNMPKSCGKCMLRDGEMCFAIDDGGDRLSLFSLEDLRDFCIKRRDDCPLIEIVHCKDCKWLGIDDGMTFCNVWLREVERHMFCNYGERK